MKVVIGLSRGGTHVFWSVLAAHPDLLCPRKEINDLVGLRHTGVIHKCRLEIAALTGVRQIYSKAPLDTGSTQIHKGVSSWWKTPIFHMLRRHDVMKYVKLYQEDLTGPVAFLLKSPSAQVCSWRSRGASHQQAVQAYAEHVRQWKRYAQQNAAVFINFEEFCETPMPVVAAVWRHWKLQEAKPDTVTYAPKQSGHTPWLPEAHDPQRKWISRPLRPLLDELNNASTRASRVAVPEWIWELYESIDFLSPPHEGWN